MRAFEPAMIEQVDIFIQAISHNLEKPIDVKSRCSYLGFDIAGLLSFGYALHLQTNEKNQFLAEHLARANHRMNVFMQIPIIPRYKLQTYINVLFRRERERTARLIETMIRSRMADDIHAHRDLYSFVADAVNSKDDEALRLGDLWYEAFFFIIAGLLAGPSLTLHLIWFADRLKQGVIQLPRLLALHCSTCLGTRSATLGLQPRYGRHFRVKMRFAGRNSQGAITFGLVSTRL